MSKLCPVCEQLMSRKARGDTCSWICGMDWRNMKATEKNRRFDRVYKLSNNIPLDPSPPTPTEISPELKEILSPTIPDPQTELDKIFGKKEGTE